MVYGDFCRTDIEFVNAEQFQEQCMELPYRKLVLIMSEQAAARYGLESFADKLGRKYELLWIKESVSYPTQEMLKKGLDALRDFRPEAILAVGGGSAIDFAKGMKAFYNPGGEMTVGAITELLQKKEIRKNCIDIIAVPTTAGTGAEVTKWATVWDDDKKCKYSIDQDVLKPDKAYIVPEFAAKADKKLTIATGLDSMAHAMEAYWSKKTSPLVRALTRESIRTTIACLGQILNAPSDVSLREKQCVASVLSGLAFSMTRTTACHSISYPLTMQYRIPHGIAVAMTLAQVAERNHGVYEEEAALLSLFEEYGGIRAYLERVCGAEVSLRLRNYQVAGEAVADIAHNAFTLGRMDNNPVGLKEEDVIEILERTY